MSLDTLLSVLFVVVFIVLPLVSRILQARNRSRGGGRVPTGGAAAGPRTASRSGPSQQGEAPKWLAEAQRRVQEAKAEATRASVDGRSVAPQDAVGPLVPSAKQQPWAPGAPTDTLGPPARAGGLVPEDPFERGLVGREGQRSKAGLGPEGPASAGARGELVVMEIESRVRPAAASERAPGRPPGARHGARLRAVGQLRFDRGAIVSGLIWHEVLDEPAWKRRRGRLPSRLRSR